MLPSIHDHTLLGYRVLLGDAEVVLRTMPDQRASQEPGFPREIIFGGCAAHHFENASEGTILGWLLEVPLEKFIFERAALFDEGYRRSGWPPWWRGSVQGALEHLKQRRIHAYEITSSYGLYGWVMAASVREAILA